METKRDYHDDGALHYEARYEHGKKVIEHRTKETG